MSRENNRHIAQWYRFPRLSGRPCEVTEGESLQSLKQKPSKYDKLFSCSWKTAIKNVFYFELTKYRESAWCREIKFVSIFWTFFDYCSFGWFGRRLSTWPASDVALCRWCYLWWSIQHLYQPWYITDFGHSGIWKSVHLELQNFKVLDFDSE